MQQRRGLIFALHANGITYNRIGAALGISGGRARQLDRAVCQRILRLADRRFPLPPPPPWGPAWPASAATRGRQ